MSLARRYADLVTRHSKVALLAFLVATVVVASAAGSVESDLTIASFETDSEAAQKLEYVRANFTGQGANTTAVQVVVEGENVLAKDSLLRTLRLQQSLRANETVNATLAPENPTAGLANLVAIAAAGETGGEVPPSGDGSDQAASSRQTAGSDQAATGGPAGPTAAGQVSLQAQIETLESRSAAEVESVVAALLDPEATTAGGPDPYALLPTSYEAGSTTAAARILFVFQALDGGSASDPPPAVTDAQLAIRDAVAAEFGDDGFAFGSGIVSEESGQATGESFAIISPVALLLLLGILAIAYRDLLDVLLGFVGVVLVLVWMAGFMGWAGIGVTQILIAVPFLLIGLSIDYALHVVMRYREADAETGPVDADQGTGDGPDESGTAARPTPREAMRRGLSGVVVAIAAATVTTSVGFLSNAVSPIVSIREFGFVAAAGIVSAFVVFAVFLPAIKVELEGLLRRVGFTRRKAAFGRGPVAGRVLRAGGSAARRAPVAVLVVALVLAAGGGVAATDVETSIDQVDFLPSDSPAWMDSLPEPFRPGDYRLKEQAIYLNDEFVQARGQSEAIFLVQGPVTDPDTLDRLAAAERDLAAQSTPITLASGALETEGPLETVDAVAARNETVASVVAAADGDGDGVPDGNLTGVYDAVFAAAPQEAGSVIHREAGAGEGTYRALRLQVAIQGGSDTATVASEMRAVATDLEADTDLQVTATGTPIVQQDIQAGLLRTLVEGFLLTLGVILVFLTAIFWRRYDAPTLGAVVLLPVVCALAWILGTMYLAGIAFNSETAIIAGIAIGIGVDYAIHVGERFLEERGRTGDVEAALDRTVLGTGGALLASAVSTASGFGVLMLALVPSLQRFGFVTSVAILYAFVASVTLLPGLLILWDRWRGEAVLGPAA